VSVLRSRSSSIRFSPRTRWSTSLILPAECVMHVCHYQIAHQEASTQDPQGQKEYHHRTDMNNKIYRIRKSAPTADGKANGATDFKLSESLILSKIVIKC
ncbi:hypothetical protein PFISCL1PPCAC_15664, partial [Pristionchus fissidentatus]